MAVVLDGRELVGGYRNGQQLSEIRVGTSTGSVQVWQSEAAPVAFKGVGTSWTSDTFQYTQPAGTTFVVLDIHLNGNGNILAVGYGDTAMTLEATAGLNNNVSSGEVFRFVAAVDDAPGSKTIQIIRTGPAIGRANIVALSGVDADSLNTFILAGQTPGVSGPMSHGPVLCPPGGLLLWTLTASGTGSNRTITDISGGTNRYVSPASAHAMAISTSDEPVTTFSATISESFWQSNWCSMVTAIGPAEPPIAPKPPPLRLVQTGQTLTSLSVKATGVPDGVDALKGWNFYIDGVKDNSTVRTSADYTFTDLSSGTEYALTVTAVDINDDESDPSEVLLASTLTDTALPVQDRDEIDLIVSSAMSTFNLPAVAVSIRSPLGEYDATYGYSDPVWQVPLTLQDHFRMFSTTKSFTATAVLQQIDANEISLSDTVDQYVSGVPNGDLITVEHLLTMRAGLPSYDTYGSIPIQFFLNPNMAFDEDDALDVIRTMTPSFAPGTDYLYSNSNYMLLGHILENVTGQDIRVVLADVIDAAGLTHTSWPGDSNLPTPYCNGFKTGLFGGQRNAATNMNPSFLGPAGGLVTNILDLRRWGEVMRDGTLMSPAAHSLWLSTFYPVPYGIDPGPDEFGYGLGLISFGEWFGHDGSYPGYECCTFFHPPSGTVIATMGSFQTATLSVFSTVFAEIAEHLYPGSLESPGYTSI
ncbi:minor tail protein [Mycobacterium phage Boilgate]|nr:minor tail protein [Mycobacterium phage Boilgate]